MRSAQEESDEDDEDAMGVDESAATQLFQFSEKPEKIASGSTTLAPVLSLGGGFKWDGVEESQETGEGEASESEDGSESGEQLHKRKK